MRRHRHRLRENGDWPSVRKRRRCSFDSAGAIDDTDTRASASVFFPHTAKQAAFQDQMRKLWEDHVTWTRLTIVSAVGGTDGEPLPDLDVTVERLQANQDDIGAAIVPFFGQAAGDHLAALLHEHISGAIALVLAAKAGDADEVKHAAFNGSDLTAVLDFAAACVRLTSRVDAVRLRPQNCQAEVVLSVVVPLLRTQALPRWNDLGRPATPDMASSGSDAARRYGPACPHSPSSL
jgi:hypothetical protein